MSMILFAKLLHVRKHVCVIVGVMYRLSKKHMKMEEKQIADLGAKALHAYSQSFISFSPHFSIKHISNSEFDCAIDILPLITCTFVTAFPFLND